MGDFHTSNINEKYYATNNTPSFYQFKSDNYHFLDEMGRKYMIDTKGVLFNNLKFQNNNNHNNKPKECIMNNYGEITLSVKIPTVGGEWFKNTEIGQFITLFERSNSNNKNPVLLKSVTKPNRKSKTGSITVSGLERNYCNELLNGNQDF